jgi:hypothetical protein
MVVEADPLYGNNVDSQVDIYETEDKPRQTRTPLEKASGLYVQLLQRTNICTAIGLVRTDQCLFSGSRDPLLYGTFLPPSFGSSEARHQLLHVYGGSSCFMFMMTVAALRIRWQQLRVAYEFALRPSPLACHCTHAHGRFVFVARVWA